MVVVVWHWVLSVTHRRPDGEWAMPNPIDTVPGLWLLTWVGQVVPVFFLAFVLTSIGMLCLIPVVEPTPPTLRAVAVVLKGWQLLASKALPRIDGLEATHDRMRNLRGSFAALRPSLAPCSARNRPETSSTAQAHGRLAFAIRAVPQHRSSEPAARPRGRVTPDCAAPDGAR